MTTQTQTLATDPDSQLVQRLAVVRQALLAAGGGSDPEQALAQVEQAQRQLQQVLQEYDPDRLEGSTAHLPTQR